MIQPIVEGYGDVEAFRVLLRRLQNLTGAYAVKILRPIRAPRSQLVQRDAFARRLQLASRVPGCRGIVVLLDADDDCPADLGPRLRAWADDIVGHIPCSVVLARREYESWFLGGIEALRGVRGLRPDAAYEGDPEAVRDAKGALGDRMGGGYLPSVDQAALSDRFDLACAYRRCRSFRKLVADFGRLIGSLGVRVEPWPPRDWSA